jgi:chromate reductase
MRVKLLAIAASFRADSLNKRLMDLAAAEATARGAEVEVFDYAHAHLPLYREEEGGALPEGAELLRQSIARAHGVMLAMPEYNWSIPGALKNLIDWLSVAPAPVFEGKPMLLLSASPSARGGVVGLTQLRTPLEVLGAFVYPQLVAIGKADTLITPQGISAAKEAKFLATCVADFIRRTEQLCSR